ncbi:metalloregulator ArsR/SmtB family transcription factor [Aliiglaciecola sp. CAU 1673]|uniref:ArsR/SmtB family transcription factor n=1 Tax=Aliiglaciecola sp. CAU 1673 TaxID=3032595 RepID=UPI0023DC07B6|nr:metalloregulator ArsR/SmtB family transcription factor [Aliiglaciecola sp. CAU 1673]MDF2180091.1 metalloregulator ArsR/SmtB family transcription factor [Aliiglaciecola sp. CAU 1673]
MSDLELQQDHAAQAAAFLRSLGNEHRLQILCRLALGEMNVGELHKPFDLSPSSFSQHLAVLREQGLVKCRKEAQTVYYSIKDPDTLKFMQMLKDKFCPEM